MNTDDLVHVVDDDPAVLGSVEALLSQCNYRVECYLSARDFLEKAEIDSPACLISDVQMPVISGPELLHRLNDLSSPISMIVVTGVADVPTAVALMESGAVTLLEKPYEQTALLSAVERALITSRKNWSRRQAERSVSQRLETLSEEERTVMKLLLAGELNKGVSSKLHLSMRTVDRRRQAILKKMQVESLPELAMLLGPLG